MNASKYFPVITLILACSFYEIARAEENVPVALPSNSSVSNEAQVTRARSEIVENEAKQRSILGFLFDIAKKKKKVDTEYQQIAQNVLQLKKSIRKQATNILRLELDIERQKASLKTQLRSVYKWSDDSFLRMVFSSENMSELDRNLKYMKRISDGNYVQLKKFEKDRQIYLQDRHSLQLHIQRLAQVEQQLSVEEKRLAGNLDEHKGSLQKINLAKDKSVEKLKSLAHDKDFFEYKAQLPLPLSGELKNIFGVIEDPDDHSHFFRKGAFLYTKQDSQVKAVHDGQVVFAGEVPGYKNVVIVDHHLNYYTVYGQLSQLNVKKFDLVKMGEVIASIKLTHDEKSKVYFEVRHFSEALNPAEWLAAK